MRNLAEVVCRPQDRIAHASLRGTLLEINYGNRSERQVSRKIASVQLTVTNRGSSCSAGEMSAPSRRRNHSARHHRPGQSAHITFAETPLLQPGARTLSNASARH
jgi:hypothetical protein